MTATRTETLADWRARWRRESGLRTRPIPLARSTGWRFERGRIVHRTGGFFSVVGIRVRSDLAALDGREQPILLQPEIGILGFLLRHGSTGPEILAQVKTEPGNVGGAQLAPTVQATESNYRRRHGGAPTAWLDHFTGEQPAVRILSDSLQSEQGSRFLGKYNRNVLLAVPGSGPEPLTPAWRWVPVGLLLEELHRDFAVNTDARSALVSSDWSALAPEGKPFARWKRRDGFGEALLRSFVVDDAVAETCTEELRSRLAAMAAGVRIDVEEVPLGSLGGWAFTDDALDDRCGAGFDVRFFDVDCAGREVDRWDQPLVASRAETDAVLLVQRRQGILHLLFRGSPEPGFRDRVQLGPTAQTGLPRAGPGKLAALALDDPSLVDRADVLQSDEGGRFFRSVTRYRIREVPEGVPVPQDPFGLWVTVSQAHRLAREPGRLTNEARSLLSLLLPWL